MAARGADFMRSMSHASGIARGMASTAWSCSARATPQGPHTIVMIMKAELPGATTEVSCALSMIITTHAMSLTLLCSREVLERAWPGHGHEHRGCRDAREGNLQAQDRRAASRRASRRYANHTTRAFSKRHSREGRESHAPDHVTSDTLIQPLA